MTNFNSSFMYAQKVFSAIDYCREYRSPVNDIFYFSSLKYIDSSCLDSNIMSVETAEIIFKIWIECYRRILEEKHLLNEKSHKHLIHWQELLMLPPIDLH